MLQKKLITLYTKIFNYLGPKYTKHLVFFAKNFLAYRKKYIVIIFIFEILPRSIIILVFIFEIYIKHLNYYFYSLSLLLIPTFFRFFIFILTDIGPRLLPEFQKMVIIETKNTQLNLKNTLTNVTLYNIK